MNLFLYALATLWSLFLVLVGYAIGRTEDTRDNPRPLYYVQHPDGSFTRADPQP